MDGRTRRNLGVLLLAGAVWVIGMGLMSAEDQSTSAGLGQGLVVVGGLVALVTVVLVAVDLIRSR